MEALGDLLVHFGNHRLKRRRQRFLGGSFGFHCRWTDGAQAYQEVIHNRGVSPDLQQKWADPAIDPPKKDEE